MAGRYEIDIAILIDVDQLRGIELLVVEFRSQPGQVLSKAAKPVIDQHKRHFCVADEDIKVAVIVDVG